MKLSCWGLKLKFSYIRLERSFERFKLLSFGERTKTRIWTFQLFYTARHAIGFVYSRLFLILKRANKNTSWKFIHFQILFVLLHWILPTLVKFSSNIYIDVSVIFFVFARVGIEKLTLIDGWMEWGYYCFYFTFTYNALCPRRLNMSKSLIKILELTYCIWNLHEQLEIFSCFFQLNL